MNKQEYIEQGRQNYKDGGDAFVPAVSWQQRAHNQGWDEARAQEAARATPIPECAASGRDCSCYPVGPSGESQCLYCGKTLPETAVVKGADQGGKSFIKQAQDVAQGLAGLSKVGRGMTSPLFHVDDDMTPRTKGERLRFAVTHALETLTDVRGDSQHALRSHAWALIARAHVVAGQGNTARADDLTEKARRIVSHLLGREL